MPRLMSVCVVVSPSHLTKYASRGVVPWNAPWRNRFCMNAPTFEPDLRPQRLVVRLEHDPLRAADRGSPRGTAPVRRTGTYFHSRRQRVGAARACARPRRRCPTTGKVRRQLTPSGLSTPFSPSVSFDLQLLDAGEPGVEPGRRLPDAARGVGARHHAGDRRRTAGSRRPRRPAAGRARAGTGSRSRRSAGRPRRSRRGSVEARPAAGDLRRARPSRDRVDDEERAVVGAEGAALSLRPE